MKRILLLVLVMILALVGCTKEVETTEQVTHSPEVLKAISDLDVLIESAEKVHPDLYKYTDKDTFNQSVETIKESFETGDQVEFYQLVAPLFASLKDGKTILEPLADYFKYQIENGDHFFPYQVSIKDNRIFLESSYTGSEEISLHSEVTAINGKVAEDVLKELESYISGTTQAEIEYGLIKEFHRLYYVVYGESEKFEVSYVEDGIAKEMTLTGASIDNIVLQPLPEVKTHTYEVIEEGVGLISIYKFDGFSSFKRFMEATFIKIEENPIDTLIIDIRDNIGGNTEYSKYLMSYLTDMPFKLYGTIEAKISEAALLEDSYMKENFSNQIGETVAAEFNEETRPYEEVIPFEGKVYVAIANDTFAAASEFAALVKDYEVATLIGEATGTNPSSFKSIHLVTAPNLNTRLAVPYQYFARPSGGDTEMGVTPDIEVDGDVIQYILENQN
ncbi:MAG: hypothetical protein JEZ08_08735 [Clostridiales bacterium]|nr:hypothetical protein [Clostridiales bacterium]